MRAQIKSTPTPRNTGQAIRQPNNPKTPPVPAPCVLKMKGERRQVKGDAPQSEAELEALRRAVNRGQPFGDPAWRDKMSKQFGLESTFRPRGRPRNAAHDDKNCS